MEGIDEHKSIPNMKNMIICSIAVLSAALLAASTETTRIWPEEGESKAYVEVSSQKVIIDADGGNAVITVATNADGWDYAAEGDWFTVARQDGNALLVETLINAGAETLTGKLTVSAEKNGETVSQEVALVQRAERSVNLSAEGTAICYIARTGGVYKFDASVKGNGGGDGVSDYIANYGLAIEDGAFAELLWESRHDGDKTMSREIIDGAPIYRGGDVTFSTGRSEGNAVIAVKDGAILWSWHIWYPEAEVAGLNSKTVYEVMIMILGAMHNTPGDVGSYGLLYQWGRKDPFPAAPTLTGTTATVGAPIYDGDNNEIKITNSSQSSTADNNLAFAIANPTVCLSNYAQFNTSRDWLQADMSNDALWGNPKGAERNETNDFLNKGAKSFYDPCPVGWRVPPADVFRNFTASGGYAWVIDDFDIADISGDGAKSLADYDYGWTFNLRGSA